MAEHGQTNITLEQAVRAGGKAHRAERYPGDLAAELGLDGGGDTATRGWLIRWRPALALCAVLAVAAGVVFVVVALLPNPPAPPVTDAKPSAPVAPVDPAPVFVEHVPAPTLIDMPPAEYAKAKQKVEDAVARAHRHASTYWSERWVGQSAPSSPGVHGSAVAISPGSLPTLSLPTLTLPRGTRLPAASFSTLRKELS